MDTKVLKAAEKRFLKKYPGGFAHPDLVLVGKKHKLEQHEAWAKENFAKKKFDDPKQIVADMTRLVSRASMVSMFEKPKFRDAVARLGKKDAQVWSDALYELLHGKQKGGFEALVEALDEVRLAKWTLATVFQSYYRPKKEVFVKPTTAKLIVDKLDLDLKYQSMPTWAFYRDFRKAVMAMRAKTNKSLAPNNPAYCGFLMMTLGDKI